MFQMFLVSFQVTHLADPKRTNTQKISTKTQKQNKIHKHQCKTTRQKNFNDKNCFSISTQNKFFKILKLNWITFCDRG